MITDQGSSNGIRHLSLSGCVFEKNKEIAASVGLLMTILPAGLCFKTLRNPVLDSTETCKDTLYFTATLVQTDLANGFASLNSNRLTTVKGQMGFNLVDLNSLLMNNTVFNKL